MHDRRWECHEVDIEASYSIDLMDADKWQRILDDIHAGRYDAYLASPPCGTFSAATTQQDGGPGQLRGPCMPELLGFKELNEEQKFQVNMGTILADRAAEGAEWFALNDRPWLIEQPARREGLPSMFSLPRFEQLAKSPHARFTRFSQCQFGQKFQKSTELLGNVDLPGWPGECTHPSRVWVIPWSGERTWGPHPPLRARQMHYSPVMLRPCEPSGSVPTKLTAHHPGALNEALADVFSLSRQFAKRKVSAVLSCFVTSLVL